MTIGSITEGEMQYLIGKYKGDEIVATIEDFSKLDIRVGTIIQAKNFEKAKNPAYRLQIDFGESIGVKKSSAQITDLYKIESNSELIIRNDFILADKEYVTKEINNLKVFWKGV